MREAVQLFLIGFDQVQGADSPQCSPLCVAFILEANAHLDLLNWPKSGRAGFIREMLRGALSQFSNRKGVAREITKVLKGAFPMSPEFRAEMEILRPQAKEKLPLKQI